MSISKLLKYFLFGTFIPVVLLISQVRAQGPETLLPGHLILRAEALQDSGTIVLGEELWKYHPGDNPAWADPKYDDTDWDFLKPDFNPDSLESGIWTGIGWFRLHLAIGSKLRNTTLTLSLFHLGASEVFLNGVKVGGYGVIGSSADEEQPFSPKGLPIGIHLDEKTEQVLAVRYAYRSRSSYVANRLGPASRHAEGFFMLIKPVNIGIRSFYYRTIVAPFNTGLILGVLILLGGLHLLLYLFDRLDRANLYFSLFAFSFAFDRYYVAGTSSSALLRPDVGHLLWLTPFAIFMAFVLIVAVYYQVFYNRLLRSFWFFAGAGLLGFMLEYLIRQNPVISFFILFVVIEGIRVTGVAIWKKKEGSWVLGIGNLVFFMGLLYLMTIGDRETNPERALLLEAPILNLWEKNGLIVMITFICIPAAMSILLARRFSQTSQNLRQQLTNVQNLSKKTLEQEVERTRLEAENERKSAELKEARQLQLSMLPREVPKLPGFDIAVYMKTATEVGGDYYDFHVGDDGTLTVVIGDATGHGLKAGTLVTATKSLFSSLAKNSNIVSTFQEMSESIKKMNLPLLSMCLAIVKFNNGEMTISSAGIPPVLVYRRNSNQLDELNIDGMPLGAIKDFPYRQEIVKLEPGDTILLMSDGFPELMNDKEEMLDYPKAYSAFKNVGEKSPKEIITHLVKIGMDWANGRPQDDDITFVVLKVKIEK